MRNALRFRSNVNNRGINLRAPKPVNSSRRPLLLWTLRGEGDRRDTRVRNYHPVSNAQEQRAAWYIQYAKLELGLESSSGYFSPYFSTAQKHECGKKKKKKGGIRMKDLKSERSAMPSKSSLIKQRRRENELLSASFWSRFLNGCVLRHHFRSHLMSYLKLRLDLITLRQRSSYISGATLDITQGAWNARRTGRRLK